MCIYRVWTDWVLHVPTKPSHQVRSSTYTLHLKSSLAFHTGAVISSDILTGGVCTQDHIHSGKESVPDKLFNRGLYLFSHWVLAGGLTRFLVWGTLFGALTRWQLILSAVGREESKREGRREGGKDRQADGGGEWERERERERERPQRYGSHHLLIT